MSDSIESLSEREHICLEHLRQAQELGVSYAEYCRSFDLNVTEWYPVRQMLVKKGLIAGRSRSEEEDKPAGFTPIRVVGSMTSSAVVCRLRHPCGWMIECMQFPDVAWMSALLAAGDGT